MMQPPRSTAESSTIGELLGVLRHLDEVLRVLGRQLEVRQVDADDHVAPGLELAEGLGDVGQHDVLLVLRNGLDHLAGDEQHELDDLGLGLLEYLGALVHGPVEDDVEAVDEALDLGLAFLEAFLAALVEAFLVRCLGHLVDAGLGLRPRSPGSCASASRERLLGGRSASRRIFSAWSFLRFTSSKAAASALATMSCASARRRPSWPLSRAPSSA